MRVSCYFIFMALASAFAMPSRADLLSEFEPNPEGTDPATTRVELSGTPNAGFNLTFLTLEAEGTAIGTIDASSTHSGMYDANGLAVITVPLDVENPAYTAMLVSGFSSMTGTDLDTNNDGILDLTPWTAILDSLNVPDSGSISSSDIFYGSNSVTAQDTIVADDEPISVFRDASTGVWYSIHETPPNGLTYGVYDAAGNLLNPLLFDVNPTTTTSTFGSINPSISSIPEPSSATCALVSLGMAAAYRRRRKSDLI